MQGRSGLAPDCTHQEERAALALEQMSQLAQRGKAGQGSRQHHCLQVGQRLLQAPEQEVAGLAGHEATPVLRVLLQQPPEQLRGAVLRCHGCGSAEGRVRWGPGTGCISLSIGRPAPLCRVAGVAVDGQECTDELHLLLLPVQRWGLAALHLALFVHPLEHQLFAGCSAQGAQAPQACPQHLHLLQAAWAGSSC